MQTTVVQKHNRIFIKIIIIYQVVIILILGKLLQMSIF